MLFDLFKRRRQAQKPKGRGTPTAARQFKIGDRVWVNTFSSSYRAVVVGYAPPDVMQKSERVIIDHKGVTMPVSASLLSLRVQEDKSNDQTN